MPADYANEPESNWTFSHALADGDILVDSEGVKFEVVEVSDDGGITALESDGTEWTWTEAEITGALAHGNFQTPDGKSHELATF